jgi:hypothetical protein
MFFPMTRVERLEADETVGPVMGFGARYETVAQRSAAVGLGWTGRAPSSRRRARRAK